MELTSSALDFQFLSPWWFLAFLLLIAVYLLKFKPKLKKSNFKNVVDDHLLEYLVRVKELKSKQNLSKLKLMDNHFLFKLGLVLATILTIFALASPVWQKLPTPVFAGGYQSLMIVLDLSQSMNTKDVLPSRLERAKFKIREILKLAAASQDENQNSTRQLLKNPIQVGLVVFSNQAYVVSPITSDVKSIEPLLSALETNLMPTYGSNLQTGITLASNLLNQSEIKNGNILVLTDSVESANFRLLEDLAREHRIHLIGVGTEAGGEIPSQTGAPIVDQSGQVVQSRVNVELMRAFSRVTGGQFQMITANNQDILSIINSLQTDSNNQFVMEQEGADTYRQEYYWFILVAMALLLGYFRKGAFALIAVPFFLTPIPAKANSISDNIFYSRDWNGIQNFKSQNFNKALEQLENPRWKASAHFKNGEYQKALDIWNGFNEPDDFYNQGNALARLGEYEKAIERYDEAIKANPNHEKAIENKRRVLDFLKNQNQQNQQNQQNRQDNQNGAGEQNNSSNSKQNQQSGQSGESDSKQSRADQSGSNDEIQQSDGAGNNQNQSPNSESKGEQNSQNNQSSGSENNQKSDGQENSPSNEQSNSEQAGNGKAGERESNPNETDQKAKPNDSTNQSNDQNQSESESAGNQNERNNNSTANQEAKDGSDSNNSQNQNNQGSQGQNNPQQFDDRIGNQKIETKANQSEQETDQSGNGGALSPAEADPTAESSNQTVIAPPLNSEQTEKQIYLKQQLQRIEDDPGELLRRKFLYQYRSNAISPDLLNQPY